MGRSTVHYTDNKTNNSLKKLHKLLRPAGTPVQRVEYIIELLLLRIFEVKLRRDGEFAVLRQLFTDADEKAKIEKQKRLFSYLKTIDSASITTVLNTIHFPFYGTPLHFVAFSSLLFFNAALFFIWYFKIFQIFFKLILCG